MAAVLVVGAGPAGLACGRQLLAAGHQVEVLERASFAGGRMHAPWLRPDAATASRVPKETSIAEGLREIVWRLRGRPRLEPFRPERAAPLDEADLASLLARHPRALAPAVVDALRRRLDADPDEITAAFARMPLPPDVVDESAARPAPGLRVRLGWEVTAVEPAAGAAHVHYVTPSGPRSRMADVVVMAVPGPLVSKLCAGLTAAEQEFHAQVHCGRGLRVQLDVEEPPRSLVPGAWSPVGFLRSVQVIRPDPSADAMTLEVAFGSRAVDRHWQDADEAVVEAALAALAEDGALRAAGPGAASPSEARVHRYDPMLPRFPAGSLRALAAFLGRSERSGHVAFAGDHLAGPGVDAAVWSGRRAATHVAQLLRARGA